MRRALVTLAELNRLNSSSLRGGSVNIFKSIIGNGGVENGPRVIFSSPIISRNISVASPCCSKETAAEEVEGEQDVKTPAVPKEDLPRETDTDRTKVIPVETSMRYMESNAYKETYGDNHVWVLYRRNFKGQFAPKKTRRTCVRGGVIVTGNPCPICRDEYLVLDYRNTKLLQQFISPFNGEILHWDKTGLCRTKQLDLQVAIEKAKDYGTITFDVPVRQYNYEDYYSDKVRNYY